MQTTAWAARKSTELKVCTEFRFGNCYPVTLNRCQLARPDRIVHSIQPIVHSSDAGFGHYGRGDIAAVARVLVSMLAISRRAMAAGMTAFMIRLTWPGMMTGREMRTCWQALYQAGPPPTSAQEKRARGRSRCGSAELERFWSGF
jgi:hypothetical protein